MRLLGFLIRSVAALLVVLALAPAAQADVVDGGSARLKLTSGLTKTFKREGIRLSGLGTAKASRTGVDLSISSGSLENQQGNGNLSFEGGFRIRAGKRTVTVKRLVLDTSESSLRAKVNGAAMKLAETAPQQVSHDGFDLGLALKSLKLTPRAATALKRKLGLSNIFKAGRSLGSVTALAKFEFLSIRGGELTIAIDEGFRQKLQSVEVEVRASHPGSLLSASPFVIAPRFQAGQISPDLSYGTLFAEGGLSFFQPDEPKEEPVDRWISFLTTYVAFDSHRVSGDANLQPNVRQLPFSGPIATFPSATAAQADPSSGEISASSVALALSPELAGAMNELFGVPKGHPALFGPGEIFATLAFRVRTR